MGAYAGLEGKEVHYASALRQVIAEREAAPRIEIARVTVEASTRQYWMPEYRVRMRHFGEHCAAANMEGTWRWRYQRGWCIERDRTEP